MRTEEGGGKHRKNSQPGAAGHKGRHHDSNQPLARRIQRPRAHHRRHVAAEADNQRHKRFPRQTERLHQPVDHKGGARHITGILHKGEEQIHQADLRHQRQYRIDAAADPLRQEQRQPGGEMQRIAKPLGAVNKQRRRTDVEQRLQRAADIDRQQKHQVHHQQKDGNAEPAVQHNAVELLRQLMWRGEMLVADGDAQRGKLLITRGGDRHGGIERQLAIQRRQPLQRQLPYLLTAVDVAFQQL